MLKVLDNSKKAEDEVTLFYIGICFFLLLGVYTLTLAVNWVAETEKKSRTNAVLVALAEVDKTSAKSITNQTFETTVPFGTLHKLEMMGAHQSSTTILLSKL